MDGGPVPATAEPRSPRQLLAEVDRRLRAGCPEPVLVQGRVVGVRRSQRGFVTLTLADADARSSDQTRLEVALWPQVVRRTFAAALADQAVVQATGTVELWQQAARVQLRATEVVRVGHSETQASYDAALAAIGTESLGQAVPPLPLFLRRILLLAPRGTTIGDLTRDLGGWQPPTIVQHAIPGDSPDLGALVTAAVAAEPDVDLVVLARGGVIERISGWDALSLLRAVDAIQRRGQPVLVAVGHAEHTPLITRVAGYEVRHTAEAGRWLADHNRRAAARIDALGAVPEVLRSRLDAVGDRLAGQRRALHGALTARLRERRERRTMTQHALTRAVTRQVTDAAGRAAQVEGQLVAALAGRLHDRQRRAAVAAATLDGFETGIALVSAGDGGPARYVLGAQLRLEVATATVLATIDAVQQHRSEQP